MIRPLNGVRRRGKGLGSWLLAGLIGAPLLVGGSEFGGSNYMPGFYGDFYMASLGGAGVYFSNFLGYSHATGKGAASDMVLEMPGLIGVTDQSVLGGRYLWAFYPSLMYSNTHFAETASAPRRFTESIGPGDMYFVPVGVAWEFGDWSVVAFEGLVMPTGVYRPSRDVVLGRNSWAFDSNVMATRLFDGGAYEISFDVGYMVNTQNPNTDYRTGSEFHFDYLLGYHFSARGAVGVAGSYYAQTERDSGPGVVGAPVLGQSATVGPALMYTFPLGQREVSVAAKWLHEFTANNHALNDYILVRTVLAF